MQQDSQQKAQLAQYEDELARKRADSEHEKNRARNKELVALQEQSVVNQETARRQVQQQIEAERRATEQYKVPSLTCLTSKVDYVGHLGLAHRRTQFIAV